MIVVDLNQVMISNLYMQLGAHLNNVTVEEPIFRHMVLNSLRSYKQKFGSEYGELVIACDNKNYWRKQLFPYYKASRKKAQEKSELNWTAIFEILNKIKQELKDYFPYKVIDVESAEADDVIATLCMSAMEPVLILSGDKDFVQLLRIPHTKIYDPIRKRWNTHDDPAQYLREHILRGDVGDGVPNVLSSDNCLVIGERQKALTKKRMAALLNNPVEEYDEVTRRNYYRNKQLIDLSQIPQNIMVKITAQYIEQQDKKRDKLFDYFMTHRLKNLMESISEF